VIAYDVADYPKYSFGVVTQSRPPYVTPGDVCYIAETDVYFVGRGEVNQHIPDFERGELFVRPLADHERIVFDKDGIRVETASIVWA
jgi:hypothetical protein